LTASTTNLIELFLDCSQPAARDRHGPGMVSREIAHDGTPAEHYCGIAAKWSYSHTHVTFTVVLRKLKKPSLRRTLQSYCQKFCASRES
jgi:hypothetical protein